MGETSGLTPAQLRSGVKRGDWVRVDRDVYRHGADPATALDRAIGALLAVNGIATGQLGALLYDLDAGGAPILDAIVGRGQSNMRRGCRRRWIGPEEVLVGGIRCASGLTVLIDLAAQLGDLQWEQALESALRKELVTIAQLEAVLPDLGRRRVPGTTRIRRVLALRPAGAPPTESLLETLAVQLVRPIREIPEPTRQYVVEDEHGRFVARVDLAWPELGVFLELDGEKHKDQPLYDASRETAVVAATGWLCARLTWTEVTRYQTTTAHRLVKIIEQARRRPLTAV